MQFEGTVSWCKYSLRRGIVTLTWTISGNKYVCEQDVRVN